MSDSTQVQIISTLLAADQWDNICVWRTAEKQHMLVAEVEREEEKKKNPLLNLKYWMAKCQQSNEAEPTLRSNAVYDVN